MSEEEARPVEYIRCVEVRERAEQRSYYLWAGFAQKNVSGKDKWDHGVYESSSTGRHHDNEKQAHLLASSRLWNASSLEGCAHIAQVPSHAKLLNQEHGCAIAECGDAADYVGML